MGSPRLRRPLAAGTALAVLAALTALLAWIWWKPDPDRLFRQARAELQANRPEAAAAAVRLLERLREPGPFDRVLRAQVAEARQRPDEALFELGRIDDRHPLAPVARLLSGQIHMKAGRLRAAEAEFLATIALEPRSPNPRRELVYLYNLQHRQADLDAQLSALSELGTLELSYLVHWGKTRHVVWNPERDCEALARCVRADPNDRRSRLALAEGLRRLNRFDEAARALMPLPDSDPEARALRAGLALDRNEPKEFQRLLDAAPDDDPPAARLRGHLALKGGDWEAAARHFRVALSANPADRTLLFGLGSALRRAGKTQEAEPYLAAARAHDAVTPLITKASSPEGRDDPSLPARLGSACEAAGRLEEARAWYQLAIARDPTDRLPQQAVSRLARAIRARGLVGNSRGVSVPTAARPGGPTG